MCRLIDPNTPLDEAEEEAIETRMPEQWQPEPEPEQTVCPIIAASTDYDEDVPF